jgi:hypothetical protein
MQTSAIVGHGPFNRQAPWATWWIWLWGVVAGGLIVSVCFRAPFMWWSLAALVGFGVMEGYGLSNADDPYPPLTEVIREYIPRWAAFALIYAAVGLAGGTWFRFPHRWELGALVGLLGWFTAHFDVTFDAAAIQQENAKYQWYAQKLHLAGLHQRLADTQSAQSE